MRYLLIAEKLSLMKEIRSCYQKHEAEIKEKIGEIEFISLAGHVCRSFTPDEYEEWAEKKWHEVDYPMIPEHWLIKPQKTDILANIKRSAERCDGIIVATDSDVEGYGVYHLVEKYLRLGNMPTLRFIEHSLTDEEIKTQLLCMTDYHADPVHVRWKDAFLLRSRTDWLFGMNATRMMTVKTGQLMRVGRVKAPTVKLIYDNSELIENFKPETYYTAEADYGDFTATLVADGKPVRFDNPAIPQYPKNGVVEKVEKKRISTHAPKLFDLTVLQAEAGRAFGYTPEHTLEVVQSLYESKVISYPRTQCQYVSKEKAKEFPMMLSHMSAFDDLGKVQITSADIKRVSSDKQVVNDKEVQKEAHDALLPTSIKARPETMTPDERNICHMIYSRFLQQFMPKAEDDKTTVLIIHGAGVFLASGKTVVEQGWRVLFRESKEKYLPKLEEGQTVQAEISAVKKTTIPPKRLTQATLIHAMKNIASLIEDRELKKTLSESQGIGTPATRSGILSEIIQSGYAEDKKGGLYITQLGKTYIESLEGFEIVSPEFAALTDLEIKKVQRGETDYDKAYNSMVDRLATMCRKMENTIICPICGQAIIERRYSYCCKGCAFKISKEICGRTVTKKMLDLLLSGKPTKAMDFKKKDGGTFRAKLVLDGEKTVFDFSSDIACPSCGKDVRINKGGAFCDACGFKLFRKEFGKELTDVQLTQLLTERTTDEIDMYSVKKNVEYTGILYLDDNDTVRMRFPNPPRKGKQDETYN